jgi:hypothetical protein
LSESKHRYQAVGKCIYCGFGESLSDEHILPFGLGGDLVLPKASCKKCSDITSAIEGRLLRGHWWPLRRQLNLQSRHPSKQPDDFEVKIIRSDGAEEKGLIPADRYPMVPIVGLFEPAIFGRAVYQETPIASTIYVKNLIDGAAVDKLVHEVAGAGGKIVFPTVFDMQDFFQFLAKVALAYAVARRGIEAFSEIYVDKLITSSASGAMRYIGGYKDGVLGDRLPGAGMHKLMEIRHANYLRVLIQLFRDDGDPPPIYDVVVGTLR